MNKITNEYSMYVLNHAKDCIKSNDKTYYHEALRKMIDLLELLLPQQQVTEKELDIKNRMLNLYKQLDNTNEYDPEDDVIVRECRLALYECKTQLEELEHESKQQEYRNSQQQLSQNIR